MLRTHTVIERSAEILAEFLLYLGGLATLAMMMNIVADVASRSLLNIALPGTIELVSSWYMAGFVFLPLAHIQVSRRHIFVELVTEPLPYRIRKMFEVFGLVLAVIIFFVACKTSAEQAIRATGIMESWDAMSFQIPVWPTRWFVPIACGFCCVICIIQIFDDLWVVATGKRIKDAWERPGGSLNI